MSTQENKAETQKSASERAAANVVLCFFAAFNVCFFVPMDIFFTNAGSISFPIKPLMLFMGLITLAVFAVLFTACMLIRGKANDIFRAAVFGVAAGLYIQGNFLAVNMGVLDGSNYDLPAWKAVLNTVIWLVILAAPFVILKKLPKVFGNIVSYVPAAIILIQVIALGISAYTGLTGSGTEAIGEILDGDTRWINTTAGLDTYSENKNLIVIVADEYDSYCFDCAAEQNPDAISEFDGFTYYPNTVGKFGLTSTSLNYILSKDMGENSYSNTAFFDAVSENFRTNFYTGTYIPPANFLAKYSDNMKMEKITLGDTRVFANGIYKVSLFRCVPEVLKPLFQIGGGDIEQELNAGLVNNLDLTDGVPEYNYYNYPFYQMMPRELNVTDENVFKFIYIFGLHEPHGITSDLEPLPEFTNTDFTDAAVAVNKILNEYLKILKDHGVYDNSEIIIMADHGHYDGKKFPLLMYKPAHQTGTGITISNAPISHDDMYPTLMKLAGGETDERTIFDIGEYEERVRYFGQNGEEIIGSVAENRK